MNGYQDLHFVKWRKVGKISIRFASHPNFTTFSNRSVPLLVELERNGTWEGDEFQLATRWDIFYMIDKTGPTLITCNILARRSLILLMSLFFYNCRKRKWWTCKDKFERHQMDSIVGEDPFRESRKVQTHQFNLNKEFCVWACQKAFGRRNSGIVIKASLKWKSARLPIH